MTRTLTFTVVLACAAALLGAAGLGCSSSDRRVRQAIAPPVETPAAPLTEAEQAVKDVRVALATADKLRDAASYGTEELNRVGDVIVTRRLSNWDDVEGAHGVTGWRAHFQARNTGSRYLSVSQSYRDGSSAWFVPWYDDGELVLNVGTGLAHRPLQHDPGVWSWRVVDTSAAEPAGRTSSHAPIDDHGLGAAWQGFTVSKTYEDAGTLSMRVFTDLTAAASPGEPSVRHPARNAAYPDVKLDGPAVPDLAAGRDGQWVYAGGDGLRGSLNGARGTFSCAAGDYGYCGLESGPAFLAPGYTPDVAADPVIFTPDDGGVARRLPHPTPAPLASANYLAFGSWQYVPDDVTAFDLYDAGMFVSGDDPFRVANLQALTGTANYAGDAAGTYADDVDATLNPFSAKVALTAHFGSTESYGRILGVVYGFEIEGGKTSPLKTLNLNGAPWRDEYNNIFEAWPDNAPLPGGVVEGWTGAEVGTARWRGSWGGAFYGNGTVTTLAPSAFAGTFGATDGEATFAGSFGARRRFLPVQ